VPAPRLRALALLSLALGLSACDAEPGAEPITETAPVVSALSFTPQTLTSADVAEGLVQASVTLQVRVEDTDGDLARLSYLVRSPLPGAEAVASGSFPVSADGLITADFPLTIPAAEVGAYQVRVYAEDAAGRLSNSAIGTLRVDIPGSPPRIASFRASPDPFVPGPGAQLQLTASVEDPDGVANIARVEAFLLGGGTFDLADDGRSLGDGVANDGTYTTTFEVESLAPGAYPFYAFATDYAGNRSDTVSVAVVVQ
jgi:hypothetical protein